MTINLKALVGGSSVIKSIQRGATTGSATVTINEVNLSKSFISCNCENGFTIGNASPTYYSWALTSGARFTSSTQLEIARGNDDSGNFSSNPTLNWEVIEYV